MRGSWRPNMNCNILTPNLWPSRCVFLVLLMLNRSPGVHSAGCWLSLLHLLSIFSEPQTPSGFLRAPSPGCGFPYHISSPTGTRTQLSSFCSIRLYITFKLPRGDMDIPPQFLSISGDRDVSLPLSLEWPV